MTLFIILGAVVLIALIVLGVLFYMLSKEGKKEEASAVALTDINQLKKELSSGLPEPEIVPPFEEPKVSLPTQPAPVLLDDSVYKKRAKELEDELQSILKRADGQSDEAKHLIDDLTQDNESLKAQKADLEQARVNLAELQAESASLKADNMNLQTQLDSTNAQVQLLEEQMAAVKIQMGEEISNANALAAPKPDADEVLRQENSSLKSELVLSKQNYEDLERTQQKLRELNVSLIEQGESLQYELVKARAQSSGLERVSFNYKSQLEDFLKKVSAAEVANDQLSQVKNRLEGTVEEVKLQNEELVKKDQLSQFELEKNRSRLVALERECEDLKVRIQRQNQQ